LQVIEISAFDRYEKVNLQKMSKNKYAPKIKERNDIKDREVCRWFRFAQLAKGKSLGRSKPETNS